METPGPDHPITISPAAGRYRARVKGHVIADTTHALTLKEADYPQVVYFPRQDVEMGFLALTEHHTHCPYKGDASYFSMKIDGDLMENAVWSYQEPYPAMAAIKDYVAFYTDKVEVYTPDLD
jgi:uncharacterized protein (DUF427 family)